MECAGNGRASSRRGASANPGFSTDRQRRVDGHAASKHPAGGWRQRRCRGDCFYRLDQGVEGDQIQLYQRSLTLGEATRDEVLLVYEMNWRNRCRRNTAIRCGC
jgi:hypothetical protein